MARFVLFLLLIGQTGAALADNSKIGLYIICSSTATDNDDVSYNRFIGTAVLDFITQKMQKQGTEVVGLNARFSKRKLFRKQGNSFYIDERKIDSLGKLNGCKKVLVLYFGYSKKLAGPMSWVFTTVLLSMA